MLKSYQILRSASARIGKAAEKTLDALNDGRVEQEPHFTDRMLGRVECEMDRYEHNGVSWRAKTLTDRAAKAQESRYGADFMGVVKIELPGFSVNKGFLAQAKLIKKNGRIKQAEYKRMQTQCGNMLALTPASFVFLYFSDCIRVVPAITIFSCNYINFKDLYSRSIGRFFEDHFSCFIGDGRIHTPNISSLDALALEYRTRSVLALHAMASENTFITD